MTSNIITTIQDKIATITIHREKSYNSLSLQCIEDITSVLSTWENDPMVKVIILTGAGNKSFVSGADISEFTQLKNDEALAFSHNGQRFLQIIEDYPKPIIASINGYALGGGFELALACHIRIAADHAKMGLPEVKLGIIPGYGGTQRLIKVIGKSRAIYSMLTGRSFDAQWALSCGIISEVHSIENLAGAAYQIATTLAQMPRESLSGIIASCNAHDNSSAGFIEEARRFEKCVAHNDFREGVSAFLEKRVANFE